MAEAIGLAASVVGILTLACQVTALSYKYLNNVKNASKDVEDLRLKLTSLSGILAAIHRCEVVNEVTLSNGRDTGQNPLTVIETSLQQCTGVMEEMKLKLENKSINKYESAKAALGVIESLKWPLKEKEMKDYTKKPQGFKSTFTLAISVENNASSALISNQLTGVEKIVTKMASSQDTTKKKKILEWISCIDYTLNHLQASKLKTAGTGQWFLDNTEFQSWIRGEGESSRRLWLHGIPGAGRSILISTVIDHIKDIVTKRNGCGFAYFYFDFQDDVRKDSTGFLASIICQILSSQTPSKKVEAIYDRCSQYPPTLSDLRTLFVEATSALDIVYIVVDALDECKT